MIIGVPKEIKNNENRVGLTPSGVASLTGANHKVYVETTAGEGSGFLDREFEKAGAFILPSIEDVYDKAEMIVKVKEPLESEFELLKENQILFTYLHLAAATELTQALIKKKVVSIAYETVQLDNGALPLLTPMSEIAGRMSVQVGAQFLEKTHGGRGVLLSGVPGVEPANVVIVGGGIAGTNAAKIAVGMGAQVVILDINISRLRYLDDIFKGSLKTLASNSFNLEEQALKADLLISSVLIPGAKAPKLVTEKMVRQMKPGSVIVDIAIDQGGSVETVDRATTHADPVYVKHDVIHYSVANMPGALARTSTLSLTNSTFPYVMQLANKGYVQAVKDNKSLAKGINVLDGKVIYKPVAEALGLEYTPLEEVLK